MRYHGVVFVFVFVMMILFVGVGKANASLQSQLELESKLQEKISSVVRPLDPHAQVIVKVAVKKIDAAPPMSGVKVAGFMSMSEPAQFSFEDIRSVSVRIISKVDPFPDSIRTLISNSVSLPGVKVSLQFEKMNQVVLDAIASREDKKIDNSESQWKTGLGQFKDFYDLERQGLFALSFLGGLFLLLGVLGAIYSRNFIRAELLSLKEALKNQSEAQLSHSMNAAPVLEAQQVHRQIPEAQSSNGDADRFFIQSLGTESLAALLSDCYWCEDDSYAVWLWSKMSPLQRTQVLSEWRYAETYVSTLPMLGEPRNHHNHPYYLKPLPVWDVSQDDVTSWLKTNPSSWHLISPMRQAGLTISLFERLHYIGQARVAQVPTLPSPTTKSRQLSGAFAIHDISEIDELEILQHPERVPDSIRDQIQSLVWLGLLPAKAQEEILATMSAQQIAQAWLGPEELLMKIAKVIGDKKMKLLKDYRERVEPSRKSVSMAYVVQESLKRLRQAKDSSLEKGYESAA